MRQRIKEGFYFVSRGCESDKYLFIKVLPAYKNKLSKKINKFSMGNFNSNKNINSS